LKPSSTLERIYLFVIASLHKVKIENQRVMLLTEQLQNYFCLSTSGARLSFCHFKIMCRSYQALEV
jgi:hypothetical protein